MQIIPGILEQDWEEVEKKLKQILTFTNVAHIDVIDGKFVDNKTFLDPTPFAKYKDRLFLEVHLMVEEPLNYVKPFGEAGFRRFIGHVEKMSSQQEFVDQVNLYGKPALALDGPTHINAIKVPFEQLDSILIYTSHKVGFAGPPMMDDRLDKLRHLKKLTNIPLEVDGGVKAKTIEKAQKAGASRFVATSFIWSSDNPKEKFELLKRSVM